jgi:hypothetical protein
MGAFKSGPCFREHVAAQPDVISKRTHGHALIIGQSTTGSIRAGEVVQGIIDGAQCLRQIDRSMSLLTWGTR